MAGRPGRCRVSLSRVDAAPRAVTILLLSTVITPTRGSQFPTHPTGDRAARSLPRAGACSVKPGTGTGTRDTTEAYRRGPELSGGGGVRTPPTMEDSVVAWIYCTAVWTMDDAATLSRSFRNARGTVAVDVYLLFLFLRDSGCISAIELPRR